MGFRRKDQYVDLLKSPTGSDLTLAEALEAANVPLSLIGPDLDTEDWFVIGQRLCHGGLSVTAGAAGTRSQQGLANVNPSAEQRGLIILESVKVTSEAAASQQLQARANATITGGGSLGFVRDSRWGTQSTRSVYGFLGQQNTLPVTGSFLGIVSRLAANSSTDWFPWPAVIGPGDNIAFDMGADQLALAAFFWWRELDLRAR